MTDFPGSISAVAENAPAKSTLNGVGRSVKQVFARIGTNTPPGAKRPAAALCVARGATLQGGQISTRRG